MMKKPSEVAIGKSCIKCGRDKWYAKRAYKVCTHCSQRCWLSKVVNDGRWGTQYLHHQSDLAPDDAIVICPQGDEPYRGKHQEHEKAPECV